MSPNVVGSPNSVDIVGSMLLMAVQTKECDSSTVLGLYGSDFIGDQSMGACYRAAKVARGCVTSYRYVYCVHV